MKKKSLLAAVLSIMLLFAFAGCGSSEPTTLESYFNDNPDQKEALMETMAGADGQGVLTLSSDISENTFTVTGTMTQTYPESSLGVMAEAFDGQISNLESQVTPAKKSMSETTGVSADDIIIKVVYCNGDGTEIWSKDF
ncbi:MAG: DUF4854 domain-containing protein [Clostridia bacterium]|nr:DUF4854 domain-containing protein [Clostridia bacterium]